MNSSNVTALQANKSFLGQLPYYQIIYRNVFYLFFLLLLPVLVLTVLNIRLVNALNEVRRRRREMVTVRQKQDDNVTLVLIIVVFIFTICQTPALVNQILWTSLRDNKWRECGYFQFYFSRICNTMVMLNSSINFLVYFLFNVRFRKILLKCVCNRLQNGGMEETACQGTVVEKTTAGQMECDGPNQTLL